MENLNKKSSRDFKGIANNAQHRCEFLKYCKYYPTQVLDKHLDAFISNLICLTNGEKVIKDCFKSLSKDFQEELKSKITNITSNSTTFSCDDIHKLGFDSCPCNGCGVKFPSELGTNKSIEALIEGKAGYTLIILILSKIPLEGEREKYIALLKDKYGINKSSTRNDIDRYILSRKIYESKAKPNNTKEQEVKKELTDEEKEKAMAILIDKNYWENFLDIIHKLGYVGEEDNKVMLHLAITSRKLSDPINITVKGESSGGKSYTVQGVIQFLPEEDVLEFTAITPKALYHRKDSLAHKVLVIYERHGAEESDYTIRTLQSEKKLVLSSTVKNPDTGEFESKDVQVDGPVAYIETTTQTRIHQENETRCFDIHIDESEEQTKMIHEAQNRKHEIVTLDREDILKPWKDAQRLLKPLPVYIPYINLIKFPTKPLRVRRDKPRFIALIEASALLFQYSRKKKIINGKEFIIADIEDYSIAYSLMSKILESVLKGLSPKIKELIALASQFENEFTKKELRTKTQWNVKTIDKYVADAVDWGYFEITKEGGRGKAYHYKLAKRVDTPLSLLSPDELALEMTTITSNTQSGNGDFNHLPLQNLQAINQFRQHEIVGHGG